MSSDLDKFSVPNLSIHDVDQLSDEIAALYNNEILSDVILVVDNFEIPAHRIILAARSAYFRALFFGDMKESKENKVILKRLNEDIPIEAFKILLKYAYSGKMELQADQFELILEVLGLMDKYAFVVAAEKISKFLETIIDVQNVCDIFAVASLYNLLDLKNMTLEFIDDYAQSILFSENFYKLPYKALLEITTRNSLDIDELELFNAIVLWAKQNSLHIVKSETLFKNIRLSLIDPKILLSDVRSTGYFSSDDILEAINDQLNGRKSIIRREKIPKENVATLALGAKVIEGYSHPSGNDPSAILFNGEININEDVNHLIGQGSIMIQLNRRYMLNSIGFLLWNGDDRSYSYYIEVSDNGLTWTRLGDYAEKKGWQIVHFESRPIQFIKFVGTYNSKRDCFCLIHLECPIQPRTIGAVKEQEENSLKRMTEMPKNISIEEKKKEKSSQKSSSDKSDFEQI